VPGEQVSTALWNPPQLLWERHDDTVATPFKQRQPPHGQRRIWAIFYDNAHEVNNIVTLYQTASHSDVIVVHW
jgi:hypothetical protein